MTPLTDYVKNSTGFGESTIAAVMSSAISFITTSLRSGEEVKIENLGIFKITDKPERQGRNPRTGEPTTFKASRKPKLSFSKNFVGSIQPDPAVEVAVETATVAVSFPPIPADLLVDVKAQLEFMWQIKAPDNSFVEVPSSELTNWGVTANTPIYSPATGWKLAGKVPELVGIVV
ncbi:MAG: HU family DNA-binding protein [Oscillatoriales cyanobacterium]|uniref:HU family DNA-binding protein n=1 Tax=unclassified Microcoleus TaxID=2642155 RepID=UPI001DD9CC7B|nr:MULTISPECIES: HU family DNA-binding protein [unclassified Microcoleus]TAF00867.1 MAG: HU family DNA-binding protein [Oscillatoriales cyanobacterium]MCC3459794.1 HU family DNA-binding protein [Microcoleus sp. PH2017_11_PCY_U_A]MCC3478227.1 HU family DNA-binding protein [Microcoleus sp. PH2017_12_PCY_D_A]TAF21374.1 MAG: HU family DNA-binding protein [Oscillatoriales cyanobacterium]TAF39699.1 MAG: HU family DNA-binding protein [Oscillatoriales cyanobacterium]